MSLDEPERWIVQRWRRWSLQVAAASLAVLAVLALFYPREAIQSYLTGYWFWLGISLGCLASVMLHNLTGGAWGLMLRPVLASGMRTLPLLALLMLPLLLGRGTLYSGTHSAELASDPVWQHRIIYLSVPFVIGRAFLYLVVWLGLAFLLERWSDKHTGTEDDGIDQRAAALSGPGLILYGLTVTFASVDWVMSLEPDWSSTIYGILFAAGQMLSAMAFGIAAFIVLATPWKNKETLNRTVLRDLGNLLLAFVMIWAYMAFSQFLLIWTGNLPEEIPWYLRRLRGGWLWVGILLVVCQFALPFTLLLWRQVKESASALACIAGAVMAMQFVNLWWMIAPALAEKDIVTSLAARAMDGAALVGIGGLWITMFLWALARHPYSRPGMVPHPELHGHA